MVSQFKHESYMFEPTFDYMQKVYVRVVVVVLSFLLLHCEMIDVNNVPGLMSEIRPFNS